ncbi:PPA1309 family protein [Jatrophihabitans sp.]|uniref:PPA1309 family protein n=1 Tax=Jatrophihabitans sp. TaxID=1932789 RepID=UPI002BCA914C|nr:PPA1309 family protein [Jatrophihabitans sp.]
MPDDSSAAGPAGRRPDLLLETVAAEIEAYVGQAGWDLAPALFALVPTRVLAADPAAAALLGQGAAGDPGEISADSLTPVAQEELPDGPLDEVLARIGWPEEVLGCALSQEIVLLPPSAEPDLTDLASEAAASVALEHPDRREARLVVAVLRDGRSASILRLRSTAGTGEDDLLTGPDLAPNLVAALSVTFTD